jgi:hypothetical protein
MAWFKSKREKELEATVEYLTTDIEEQAESLAITCLRQIAGVADEVEMEIWDEEVDDEVKTIITTRMVYLIELAAERIREVDEQAAAEQAESDLEVVANDEPEPKAA